MTDVIEAHFQEHLRVVEAAAGHADLLRAMADRIIACFNRGGRLYLVGNGGSAADAQHIAAELVGRFKRERKALPAVALTTDTSILTAVANDLGAELCFERQVDGLVTDRDIVWALSVSGTSLNIIRAMKRAKAIGAERIGFTGRAGGDLGSLCGLCFHVDHTSSDRVQETHQLGYHIVCDRIERMYAGSTL